LLQPEIDDLVLLRAAEFQLLAKLFHLGFKLLYLLLVRGETGLELSLKNLAQLLLDSAAIRLAARRLPRAKRFTDKALCARVRESPDEENVLVC
jgi:hypothetical protein